MSEWAVQNQRLKLKLQYAVMVEGPYGYRFPAANVYASKVVEYPDCWALYLFGEFIANVWKCRATLELAQFEYAGAAAEAHYPVFSITYDRILWPIRGVRSKESA